MTESPVSAGLLPAKDFSTEFAFERNTLLHLSIGPRWRISFFWRIHAAFLLYCSSTYVIRTPASGSAFFCPADVTMHEHSTLRSDAGYYCGRKRGLQGPLTNNRPISGRRGAFIQHLRRMKGGEKGVGEEWSGQIFSAAQW